MDKRLQKCSLVTLYGDRWAGIASPNCTTCTGEPQFGYHATQSRSLIVFLYGPLIMSELLQRIKKLKLGVQNVGRKQKNYIDSNPKGENQAIIDEEAPSIQVNSCFQSQKMEAKKNMARNFLLRGKKKKFPWKLQRATWSKMNVGCQRVGILRKMMKVGVIAPNHPRICEESPLEVLCSR